MQSAFCRDNSALIETVCVAAHSGASAMYLCWLYGIIHWTSSFAASSRRVLSSLFDAIKISKSQQNASSAIAEIRQKSLSLDSLSHCLSLSISLSVSQSLSLSLYSFSRSLPSSLQTLVSRL